MNAFNDTKYARVPGKEIQLKMARADEKDMAAAIDMAALMDSVGEGYYPPAESGSADGEGPTFFNPDDPKHLRMFYDRMQACHEAAPGGLFRVVWGYHTLMHNDICDPNADTLELHPRLVRALDAFNAQSASSGDGAQNN